MAAPPLILAATAVCGAIAAAVAIATQIVKNIVNEVKGHTGDFVDRKKEAIGREPRPVQERVTLKHGHAGVENAIQAYPQNAQNDADRVLQQLR